MSSKRMRLAKVVAAIMFLLASSCASSSPTRMVSVVGDKIFSGGRLFAELRYLHTDREHDKHRGLAVYYFLSKREVWIFPEHGWGVFNGGKDHYSLKEIEDVYSERGIRGLVLNGKRADKAEAISAWCFDVKISDDGSYVYYKTKGVLFDSSHKYAIEHPGTGIEGDSTPKGRLEGHPLNY